MLILNVAGFYLALMYATWLLFCDLECRDGFEAEQAARRRNGN